MRVAIAAGGTAGHVLPALALGRVLRDRGIEVTFFGTAGGQEARLVPDAGFPFVAVAARPLRRDSLAASASALLAAGWSALAVRRVLSGTDVVVGMGGYASVPVCVGAVLARIPLVVHEQNAIPGLANRVLARGATVVAVGFDAARPRFGAAAVRVTGNPLREPVLALAERRRTDATAARAEAASALGLDPGAPTVVVFGGSQGARRVNDAVLAGARALPVGTQILLLAGRDHAEDVAAAATGLAGVQVLGYLDRMELAYAAADLVVARAGAMTCAEVTACGLPSVLVPYPYATDDHQLANARALEAAGAATVVLDERLDATTFAERVGRLLADPDQRDAMAASARAWARTDAAIALADLVASVA